LVSGLIVANRIVKFYVNASSVTLTNCLWERVAINLADEDEVEYWYFFNSDYGELVELHTFRGGTGWNQSTWSPSPGTPDTAIWTYDGPSGLLASKTDAASHAVSYTYTNGMLFTRAWARGVMVTNSYDSFADLVRQDYNDGTLSVQFNNYSRAGLPREIVDASGTAELTYDCANRLLAAQYTGGLLAGMTVTNHFDSLGRRDGLSVLDSTTPLLQHSFAYEAYGRMDTVSAGVYSATYGYLDNPRSRGQHVVADHHYPYETGAG
jgi:hypothetical protein